MQQFYASPVSSDKTKTDVVEEDTVDRLLRRADGKIKRGKDDRYCSHGPAGMCSHCMPLEPYDAGYQQANGIKHLSLHAHLRKLSTGSSNKGHLLEGANFKVKAGCIGHHPSYPEGICTKCQPSAIILNPQPFRIVDHVELEGPRIIEDFLAGWRKTGYQRFGWLLGRYEVYEGVPLGIKAVVCAIHEPPQDGSVDGFQLLEDPSGGAVELVASSLGLSVVGMAYTDLTDDGTHTGKVLHKRSAESFFVSSVEALFMAQNQLSRPSRCKDSPTGTFSSKFVTLILTGNAEYQIDFMAFQVSNTAEALLQADLVEATTDPNLVMVKPSIPKVQYVPEVIYKLKDEYGNTVQRTAEPFFPVEYLLLTLSHGFPVRLDPFFKSPLGFPPVVDRPAMSHLKTYIQQARGLPPSISLSHFNLLLFIAIQGIVELADFRAICSALVSLMHKYS